MRLTYQLSGPPTGDLMPLEVRLRRGGARLHAPRWGRSGAPATVAAARVRRLLAGELAAGELPVRAEVEHHPGRPEATLRLHGPPLGDRAESERPRALRITLGRGDPEDEATIRHLRLDQDATPGGAPEGRLWEGDLEVAGDGAWVAVLVEDLETGRWGADVVELQPPD